MIGFFRRVLDVAEAQRLRRRARLDSSPRSTVELCRLLQRQGRATAARDVAREGLSRFPNSGELKQILHSTWRRAGRRKVDELERRVRQAPSVASHVALIDYLLEYDETDRAAEVCAQMVQRHPREPQALLVAGKVLLARFHRDHVAQDGAVGLRHLQRATELDPQNFEGHLAMAETYYYIGAVSKALFHLYQAMDLQPDHPEIMRLHRILIRLPLEKAEESELLREVEENDEATFRYTPAVEPPSPGAILSGLEQLSLLAGVRRVVLSHKELDAVARDGRRIEDGSDETRSLLELAKGFRRTASLSAKRMGIGGFEEAEMTWTGGTILALGTGRTIVLVEVEEAPRSTTIAAEARNFLAGNTVSAGEPAHA